MTTKAFLLSAAAWLTLLVFAAMSTSVLAWTQPIATITDGSNRVPPVAAAFSATALFGKKKKSGESAARGSSGKIRVKLLKHVAETGQAGDVVMVSPILFDNKLRPKKLARRISEEEVQQDIEEKQAKNEELLSGAKTLRSILNDDDDDGDGSSSPSYALKIPDNKTGPDGKKLFGGIGPKKLLEALQLDVAEFGAFQKRFAKQVSLLDVEEREEEGDGSGRFVPLSKKRETNY